MEWREAAGRKTRAARGHNIMKKKQKNMLRMH